jgi:hypothetical protein
MVGYIKMSALSVALSCLLVTAYAPSELSSAATTSGKIFHDRILPDAPAAMPARMVSAGTSVVRSTGAGKGDRLAKAASGCGGSAWPYYAPECVTREDGRPQAARVRVITIETREGADVSVLRRAPQTELAGR